MVEDLEIRPESFLGAITNSRASSRSSMAQKTRFGVSDIGVGMECRTLSARSFVSKGARAIGRLANSGTFSVTTLAAQKSLPSVPGIPASGP